MVSLSTTLGTSNKISADNVWFIAPISKRSTIGVLRTDHEGDIDGTAAEADETIAFNSTTCVVLNPEGEVGPYYVLGEYVRSDIVDDEPGVSVVADIQFIDVSTCEPLSGVCKCFAALLLGVHTFPPSMPLQHDQRDPSHLYHHESESAPNSSSLTLLIQCH